MNEQNDKDRQYDLELYMRDTGETAYLKAVEEAKQSKVESRTSYGLSLLTKNVEKVAELLDDFLEHSGTGTAIRSGVAGKRLRQLPSTVVALIGLRCVIDNLTTLPTLTSIAINVGGMIEDEIKFRKLHDVHPGLFVKLSKQTKSATSYRHKRAVYVHAMKKAGISEDGWSTTDKVRVGVKVIDLIKEATGLIEITSKPVKGKHLVRHVVGTDDLLKWIEDYVGQASLMSPKYLPCVIPPLPWHNMYGGGYHHPELTGYLTLVKARDKEHINILSRNMHKLRYVFNAVNTMQNTAWVVNNDVLDVVNDIWDVGGDLAALPPRDNTDLPLKPDDIDYNPEALKAWKRKAAKVHEFNNRLKSKRLETAKILWIAEKFKYEENIYFPYQLDFRGRCYAVPSYLNPQGCDLSKGLLKFSEGLPLETEEAARYLAIHGANCFGYDKVNLDERYLWIKAKSNLIAATVLNPLDHRWWMEADDPFSFLAFIFEWAGYLEQGLAFCSRIPVAMDASCSGIQHFSAMTRDEVGGGAVNLIPTDEKSDIYQAVCDVFKSKLTEDLNNHKPHYTISEDVQVSYAQSASYWLALNPDRSATKRQVMVLPYGGKRYSCRFYTEEWIKDKKSKDYQWDETKMVTETHYASSLIWDSITTVVVGARKTMDWLQHNVSAIYSNSSGYKHGIEWTTPSGFIVYQNYPNIGKIRIRTTLGDTSISLKLSKDEDTVNRNRMKNSISPNFVHSMDASHLTLSISKAVTKGITAFAMVHDSFATHAAKTAELSRILRHEFIDMYDQNDVLKQFQDDMKKLISKETIQDLPTLLSKGDLDLQLINESKYFFS